MDWRVLLGGMVLGGVLGILLLYGLFKFGLWYLKRRLAAWATGLVEGLQNQVPVPARITLRSQGLLGAWKDVARVSHEISALKELGFEEIDSFTIDQMPGFHLAALVHPDGIWGVVNEHPQAGVWVDLNSRYADGSSFTVASAPETGIDQHPRHRNVKVPGGDASALLDRMLSERPAGALSLTGSEFARCFEEGYAEVMDWRINRGGSTAEEVRAVAALTGRVVSDEEVALATQMERMQALAERERVLEELFLGQISALEWERVKDRVIFVHDDLTEEELFERVGCELPPGGTPRLRAAGRFEKLGTVQGPVEADVLLGPEDG